MKKTVVTSFFIFIIVVAFGQKQQKKLTIAVAANMQFAMKELKQNFTQTTGIKCDLIIGSSGKLTAQIKEGAPFDVFVSADIKYPTNLYQSGFTTEKPKIYAFGKLVLWSLNSNITPTIELLKSATIKHIAIANPKTAPYGTAAIEALNYYKLLKTVQHKLVYGESISQTNQFIISKAAEIGFTSKSVVLSPEMKGKGNWIAIDEKTYSPIAQGVVILKNKNNNNANAEKFFRYLFSDSSKAILKKYGYSVN